MALTPFDPTSPADNAQVSGGAAAIRNLTQLIVNFLSISFNMTTGALLASAVPNGLPTPYGVAGQVLTSSGPTTVPTWQTPGNLVTGIILAWPNNTPPLGWLNCDGSTPLILSYTALASLIGTTFGGNGSTTFGLPDTRGRALVGIGLGTAPFATAWTLGLGAGAEQVQLTSDQVPSHTHAQQDTSSGWARYTGSFQNGAQPAGVFPIVTGFGTSVTGASGGGGTHTNLTPSLGMSYIIKT